MTEDEEETLSELKLLKDQISDLLNRKNYDGVYKVFADVKQLVHNNIYSGSYDFVERAYFCVRDIQSLTICHRIQSLTDEVYLLGSEIYHCLKNLCLGGKKEMCTGGMCERDGRGNLKYGSAIDDFGYKFKARDDIPFLPLNVNPVGIPQTESDLAFIIQMAIEFGELRERVDTARECLLETLEVDHLENNLKYVKERLKAMEEFIDNLPFDKSSLFVTTVKNRFHEQYFDCAKCEENVKKGLGLIK